LTRKEKILKGGQLSKHVTTLNEAFILFVMKDYDEITTKEERKKGQMGGRKTREYMKFFYDMMTEIKEISSKRQNGLLGWTKIYMTT